MNYSTVDYTCPNCGAEAVTVPDSGVTRGVSRVLVPHELGCPVAIRVAEARSRALTKQITEA